MSRQSVNVSEQILHYRSNYKEMVLKTARNINIYKDFKSGLAMRNLAIKHDITTTSVREVLFNVYNKLCRAQGIAPERWTLKHVKDDDRVVLHQQYLKT